MGHAQSTEKHTQTAAKPATWQRRVTQLDYRRIQPLREELTDFLYAHGIDTTYSDNLAFTLSEILTNLFKHPPRKAQTIDIMLDISRDALRLSVADDSTPFASFDAICKTAPHTLRCTETLAESGYGLGCVLRLHDRVCYTPAAADGGINRFVVETFLTPAPASLRKPVVFLVDDSPMDLKNHHRMLGAAYDVVPLASGAEALALFQTHRPDLIISDLHMPDMHGDALRRALSALPEGDSVPFIFLSAATDRKSDPHLLRLGIDDYLTKPVTADQLPLTAARVLQRRAQLGAALQSRFHDDLRAFLHPQLPTEITGWRICTLNRMADAGGGDFTLHHDTPDGLMAVLADVMGHGTQAKFFAYAYAGYLRGLFRMTAHHATSHHVADFLQTLSDAVADDSALDGTLLTCQSFMLGADGTATLASAGHPPPWVCLAGQWQVVPVTGAVPGLSGHHGYRQVEQRLPTGAHLLLATDGFFDVFGDGDGFARALHSLPADADIAEALWQIFETQTTKTPRPADDATLVIATYGGTP